MFGTGCRSEWIRVTSGRSASRSTDDLLKDGIARIVGTDPKGKKFERFIRYQDSEILETRLKIEGKVVHHIVYGQFESTLTEKGREVTHFRKGTAKGLHGLSRRYGTLFKYDGVCESWYKRGRLVRQRFTYVNARIGYDWNGRAKACQVRDPFGEILYEVKGALDGRMNCYFGGISVFDRGMKDWFLQSAPFEVKKYPPKATPFDAQKTARVVYAGQYENRQKVGEWVEEGKRVCYERGVAIPVKLYRTPPEKLDPKKILKLSNAQLRMALCAKIGPDRIAKCGTVIHKDGDMRLIAIKGYDVQILRVKCPSTGQLYFLRVPRDAKECEEARQWTFGVGDGIPAPIKFEKET